MVGICLFFFALILLFIGYPIAFTFAGLSMLTVFFSFQFGLIDEGLSMFDFMPFRLFDIMKNTILMAIPMFIFMGIVLQKTGLAERLLESMGRLFGSRSGGLAVSTLIVGAFLAASTGVVGASVVAMGVISLPVMLKYNYDQRLATGTICAAGTLGQIIPPSIILIILGDVMSVPVGDLFKSAMLPGLLLVGFYLAYVLFKTHVDKNSAPSIPYEGDFEAMVYGKFLVGVLPPLIYMLAMLLSGLELVVWGLGAGLLAFFYTSKPDGKLDIKRVFRNFVITVLLLLLSSFIFSLIPAFAQWLFSIVVVLILADVHGKLFLPEVILDALRNIIPPLLLILLVLGSILGGVATPTESSALGALGSLLLGRIYLGKLKWGMVTESAKETIKVTSMVFAVLIGATAFSMVFTYTGGDTIVEEALASLPGEKWTFIALSMITIFILGFFIDFVEIAFIVVPILAPIAEVLGINMIWFGILIAMNLQSSFMTPPFGFSLFYLKGVSPKGVKTTTIYKGVIPFISIQLVLVLLLVLFPEYLIVDLWPKD